MTEDMKIDFGCGQNKAQGFVGVDEKPFPGVDYVMNVATPAPDGPSFTLRGEKKTFAKWPWEDNSVEEARANHFIEHLRPAERIHFMNELWRVMKKDGKFEFTVPCWSSMRAYGDLTHEWPPVSQFWFLYLNKEWRAAQAPHDDFYTCDWVVNYGSNMHPFLVNKNDDYRNFALSWQIEATQDIVGTMICRKP